MTSIDTSTSTSTEIVRSRVAPAASCTGASGRPASPPAW